MTGPTGRDDLNHLHPDDHDPGCPQCGYTGPDPHCFLCCEPGAGNVLDHVRLIHPDQWGDGPELWPDGATVVVDSTLKPKDFR